MERARADDDEETVFGVFAMENGNGFFTSSEHGFLGFLRLWDLMLEQIRRGEWVISLHTPIFGVLAVTNSFVLEEVARHFCRDFFA
jgi:hypothetical protein